ncbi:MAG: CBS domain-containing protein [Acidobacteriota bacterium]|nr:CBS domain-containing protein [Acidobacteriota bacterium]
MTIHDPHLSHVRVADAMHTGILATDPTTPLRVVAQLMADQRVHAVAVADPDHVRRPLGFVTVAEVAAAAAEGIEETAGQAAATEVVTVSAAEQLDTAARIMVEHAIGHLIVVDPASGHPCGILSALDIAAAYAGS